MSYAVGATIEMVCNMHNDCQLTESEARAVSGGTWQNQKFKK